jgi:protein involved in polysaccharide export with SLBB domain
MYRILNKYSLIVFFLLFALNGFAQTNYSAIQVDNLSDDQVKQIVAKAQASGFSQDQIESMAIAKGMKPAEVQKLKDRIAKLGLNNGNTLTNSPTDRARTYNGNNDIFSDVLNKETTNPEKGLESKIFGFNIFRSQALTFAPSLNMPTPQNYQVGPGDQLMIDIWGASQANYKLEVSPEGSIYIENVGPVIVNGLTIENASKKIISRLSSIYSGLIGSNPNTFAQVSLGNLRSIKVSILGEVKTPGTYTLPSLATVFNALYVCGGPNTNGSLRKIEVYRESKLVSTLDAYDFILKGDQKNNIRLQDQDVVIVKPYLSRVEIKGEVKTQAIFEMKENEHLSDLISYSGGFTNKAYTFRLKVTRNTDRERKIEDIDKKDFTAFSLRSGDIIEVDSILNRFQNRVEIMGAVYRPGQFELDSTMTIKQLIEKAEGLRGDAFMSRALVYRTNKDLTISSFAISLSDLMNDKIADIKLQREDLVRVFSISELQEEYNLTIDGEVSKPGKFPYAKNMTLEDLIALAGGLKESASLSKIEIARRIKNADPLSKSQNVAEVYLFDISKDLSISDSASLFHLEPYDEIFVRRSPGYEIQILAEITGEVLYPGKYSIQNKDERISDLVNRSGGLTNDAYPKGACLYRKIPIDVKQRDQLIRSLRANSKTNLQVEEISKDTVSMLDTTQKYIEQRIGIDLVKILNKPHSNYDLILQEGDVLKIPKELQTVKLTGALLYPITVRFDKSNGFNNYISMAGGFADQAKPSKTFVIYANGAVKRTKRFLWIKFYPKIEPGAEIIVPQKPERKGSSQEAISIAASVVGMASMISSTIYLIHTIK